MCKYCPLFSFYTMRNLLRNIRGFAMNNWTREAIAQYYIAALKVTPSILYYVSLMQQRRILLVWQ